jgi:hypothetical protein
MLQYTVLENLLTPAPDEPVNVRTHDLPAIFKRIGARYPGLTPTRISSAANEFFEEICIITEEGEAANTPLLNTRFSTPGGVLQLGGSRLKFLPQEENNGVFLIDEQGIATKLSVIVENKPARIMVMLPADFPQGAYFAKVRTTFSGGSAKPIRTLKTNRFYKELTV